ncbi:hypothetical protein [Paracidovorax avenae]|uniref:hypothetical protein n=1 Tax=Paracidovorax avenae TaxID=80867 RepID=UPI001863E4BF|nr:hypothetical protein [Paracidovorax avenae]
MAEFDEVLISLARFRGIMYCMYIQFAPSNSQLPGIWRSSGAAPGSSADVAHRKAIGLPAAVLRLRYAGVFLPVHLIRPRMRFGLIVSSEGEGRRWSVNLHPSSGEPGTVLPTLADASMSKRRDDGAFLLVGLEWDDGYLRRWRQTWLCAPSEELAEQVLGGIRLWLEDQYERARRAELRRP